MATHAANKGGALDALKWLVVITLLAAAVLGNGYFSQVGLLYRAMGVIVVVLAAVVVGLTTLRGRRFNQFRKEAWNELRKVIWPNRTETTQTTLLVLVVVLLVALLLWLFDTLISALISIFIG